MPLRATWLVVSFALLACAPSRSARVLGRRPPWRESSAVGPVVARARFEPSDFDSVFRRAVRSLVQDGYEVVSCVPERGWVTTAPRELDMPCGASSCLSRQSLAVVLGYRTARVTFAREHFDTTTKGWEPSADEPAQHEADRIVEEITADEPPPALLQLAPGERAAMPIVAVIGASREPCPRSAAPPRPRSTYRRKATATSRPRRSPSALEVASAR